MLLHIGHLFCLCLLITLSYLLSSLSSLQSVFLAFVTVFSSVCLPCCRHCFLFSLSYLLSSLSSLQSVFLAVVTVFSSVCLPCCRHCLLFSLSSLLSSLSVRCGCSPKSSVVCGKHGVFLPLWEGGKGMSGRVIPRLLQYQ